MKVDKGKLKRKIQESVCSKLIRKEQKYRQKKKVGSRRKRNITRLSKAKNHNAVVESKEQNERCPRHGGGHLPKERVASYSLGMNWISSCHSRQGCRQAFTLSFPEPIFRIVGRTSSIGARAATCAKETSTSSSLTCKPPTLRETKRTGACHASRQASGTAASMQKRTPSGDKSKPPLATIDIGEGRALRNIFAVSTARRITTETHDQ